MTFRRHCCLRFQRPSLLLWGGTLFLAMAAVSAWGANGTTVGAFETTPYFNTICLVAKFSGDDNANNSFRFRWSTTSTGPWNESPTNVVDRRMTYGLSDNAESNQCRAVLICLNPESTYYVWSEATDSDGITGAANITNTVTTLTFNVPTNGTFIEVVNDTELQNAVGTTANPGDTIRVATGTYKPINWSRSGNASGWIVMQPTNGATVNIKGTNDLNIDLSASYVKIYGIVFPESATSTIEFSTGIDFLMVQNCTFSSINTSLDTTAPGGVAHVSSTVSTNIYVISNIMVAASAGEVVQYYGVTMANDDSFPRGWIVMSNTFTGRFYDAVGGGGTAMGRGFYKDFYVAFNTFSGWEDDAIEVDGPGIYNCVILGNDFMSTSVGAAAISIAPLSGNCYVARNTVRTTNLENAVIKMGSSAGGNDCSLGPVWFYHNSFSQRFSTGGGNHVGTQGGGGEFGQGTKWECNILESQSTLFDDLANDSPYLDKFNYNCYTNTSGTSGLLQQDFDHSAATNKDYRRITGDAFSFNDQEGEEANGMWADPNFDTYSTMTLNANSVCRNAGRVINGFNDTTSWWAFQGAAPDIGAVEFQEAPTQPPLKLTIGGRMNVSGRVTVGQ